MFSTRKTWKRSFPPSILPVLLLAATALPLALLGGLAMWRLERREAARALNPAVRPTAQPWQLGEVGAQRPPRLEQIDPRLRLQPKLGRRVRHMPQPERHLRV